VGEGLDVREAGDTSRIPCDQLKLALDGVSAEQARTIALRTSRFGRSDRQGGDPGRRAGGLRRGCATRSPTLYSGDLADGVRILYGGSVKGRQCGRNSRADPISTGPSLVAPASTGSSSPAFRTRPPANLSAGFRRERNVGAARVPHAYGSAPESLCAVTLVRLGRSGLRGGKRFPSSILTLLLDKTDDDRR